MSAVSHAGKKAHLTIVTLLLATSGCATFGGHVKGSFACKAPQGTCEPMSSIDARAVGSLGEKGAPMPVSTSTIDADTRLINAGYGNAEPARSADHVMRVVFPAHTDGNGIWHEEAVARFVSEPAAWVARPASADAPAVGSLDAAIAAQAPSTRPVPGATTSAAVAANAYAVPGAATSAAPLTLREAAAGLEAPRGTLGDEGPTAFAMGGTPADPEPGTGDAPSMRAIAAARAGHRLAEPVPAPARDVPAGGAGRGLASSQRSRHAFTVVMSGARAPVDYTRELNQEALARARRKEVAPPAPLTSIAAAPEGAAIHAKSDLAQPGPVEQAVSGGSARP